MEWSAQALESLVSAFAARRGGDAGRDHDERPRLTAAVPLDLARHRRLAVERRDLEPYLEMIGTGVRMKRGRLALRESCEVIAFRRST